MSPHFLLSLFISLHVNIDNIHSATIQPRIPPHEYTQEDIDLFETNIHSLRNFIVSKIWAATPNDPTKVIHGTFIRNLFHDCSNCFVQQLTEAPYGCCDGCVNYDDPFNTGLKQRGFEGFGDMISNRNKGLKQFNDEWINDIDNTNDINRRSQWSRADFIAAVSNIAIEFSINSVGGIEKFNQLTPRPIEEVDLSYANYYFGRKSCNVQDGYYAHPDPDEYGVNGDLSQRQNVYSLNAETDIWEDTILDFFDKQFGFDNFESVALVSGGHNMANSHNEEDFDVGLARPWTYRYSQWDNRFPLNLHQRSWQQIKDPAVVPDAKIYQYIRHDKRLVIAITADISMVYHILPYMDSDTGELQTCSVVGTKNDIIEGEENLIRCPYLTNDDNTRNIDQIKSYYKTVNDLNGDFRYLRDFLLIYDKMQINGYDKDDLIKIETINTNMASPTKMPTRPTPAPTENQNIVNVPINNDNNYNYNKPSSDINLETALFEGYTIGVLSTLFILMVGMILVCVASRLKYNSKSSYYYNKISGVTTTDATTDDERISINK